MRADTKAAARESANRGHSADGEFEHLLAAHGDVFKRPARRSVRFVQRFHPLPAVQGLPNRKKILENLETKSGALPVLLQVHSKAKRECSLAADASALAWTLAAACKQ